MANLILPAGNSEWGANGQATAADTSETACDTIVVVQIARVYVEVAITVQQQDSEPCPS